MFCAFIITPHKRFVNTFSKISHIFIFPWKKYAFLSIKREKFEKNVDK